MRRALTTAMKARDQRTVTALRSALAAIDNAEAVDTVSPARPEHGRRASREAPPAQGRPASGEAPSAGDGSATGARIAGAAVGVGAAEVQRRALTPAEVQAIVREEVAERQTAAHGYERAGQSAHAERLRAEAEVLSAFLDDPGAGPDDPGAGADDPGA
jgi:uncharacterized protein